MLSEGIFFLLSVCAGFASSSPYPPPTPKPHIYNSAYQKGQNRSHFLTSTGRLFSLKHERWKVSEGGEGRGENLQTFLFKIALKKLNLFKNAYSQNGCQLIPP